MQESESKAASMKKSFPGLCIPDDRQRAESLLLLDKDDVKVATNILSEVCIYIILCLYV